MLRFAAVTLSSAVAANFAFKTTFSSSRPRDDEQSSQTLLGGFASRDQTLKQIRGEPKLYDMLIIGGGAVGCNVAFDAASRGMTVALVEMDDYASCSSSRSTKLIHGGAMHLQKAVLGLDSDKFGLVKDGIAGRTWFLHNCPNLVKPLPIMLPTYSLFETIKLWIGFKLYDVICGVNKLASSRVVGRQEACILFPMLDLSAIKGGCIYHDATFNDALMNVVLAMTASSFGADIVNHVEVTKLLYDDQGQVCGAQCLDHISGEKFDVHSRSVVNATGPLVDLLRRKDNPECEMICQPSAGVHIVLPDYYCNTSTAFLDVATKDKKPLLLMPWENHTLVGVADSTCKLHENPEPTEKDVNYLLEKMNSYMSPLTRVGNKDVLSAWAGKRVVAQDKSMRTKRLLTEISSSGLITVTGGNWTTCRQMAEDVVDMAIDRCKLANDTTRPCGTKALKLLGAHQWNSTHYIRLVQDYGLDSNTAKHLSRTYGDQAEEVAKLCRPSGKRWPLIGRQLHSLLPYVDGEVRYAIKQHACSVVDIIANRTRMAFLNVLATREALPGIAKIMAEELKWSKKKQKEELDSAMGYLRNNMEWKPQSRLSSDRHGEYGKIFDEMDSGNRGFITFDKFNKYIKRHASDKELQSLTEQLIRKNSTTIGKDDFCAILASVCDSEASPKIQSKASN